MPKESKRDRLMRIERAAASSVGASVDDTLWLVREVRHTAEILRTTNGMCRAVNKNLRETVKVVTECRQTLEGHES